MPTNNTLLTFIVIAIAGVVLFVFPIMTISEKNDTMALERIQAETTAFVDKVANEGEITEESLNAFETAIGSVKPSSAQIEIQQLDENVGKKTGFSSSSVIGQNVYYSIYDESVRETISQNGKIPLKQGDLVSVEVGLSSSGSFAEGFRSAIYGITGNGSYERAARAVSEVKKNGSTN